MAGMEAKAGEAASFLKGLANPHRLLVLCQLVRGERSVTELLSCINLSQSAMSQHLAKLRAEGIVDYRREHRTLYYYICNPHVARIIGVLYDMYCKDADNSKELI